MNFVSTDLNLPLFLVTRNRLKFHRPETLRSYINKQRNLFTRHCQEENATETATTKKCKHVVGFDEHLVRSLQCPSARSTQYSRDLTTVKPWQLPPNRYDVPMSLFDARRGAGGAHWNKLRQNKSLHPTAAMRGRTLWRFYDMPSGVERLGHACHKYKGIFVSNARERRPTSRSMINNPLTCYRNPNEPGSTTYYPHLHEIAYNVSPKIKEKPPNPYIFLARSCVPAKRNAIHARNISFAPGPGRYENRFRIVCHCSAKRIYQPGLQMMIEHEKRLKFRRLPYKKIKSSLYCSPDWRHVTGRGHRWLFKNIPPPDAGLKKFKPKKTDKQYQLYPDARYINMITSPIRPFPPYSFEPIVELPVRVRYNCISKRVVRRQLRNNKKIAFMSGQERFKDADRPPPLTVSQLEAAKQRLPIERQLRDYPCMKKSIGQIPSKLMDTPSHMLPAYELELRKRLFKFLPLPGPKILVTVKDTRPKSMGDIKQDRHQYYAKKLDPINYLKKDTPAELIQML